MSDERNSVMMGGTRLAINTPVSTGTSSSHGDMQKRDLSASANVPMSWAVLVSHSSPATANTINAITIDGTVV